MIEDMSCMVLQKNPKIFRPWQCCHTNLPQRVLQASTHQPKGILALE